MAANKQTAKMLMSGYVTSTNLSRILKFLSQSNVLNWTKYG